MNDAAAHPSLTARLTAEGEREWGAGATGTGLLSTVARDAVELFTGVYAHRIRTCGADDCRLLFVDTSRPGKRRWCSMERCARAGRPRRRPVDQTIRWARISIAPDGFSSGQKRGTMPHIPYAPTPYSRPGRCSFFPFTGPSRTTCAGAAADGMTVAPEGPGVIAVSWKHS
ncbi:hypothetical protein SMICM17S_02371 [Streptomyces microflavus]